MVRAHLRKGSQICLVNLSPHRCLDDLQSMSERFHLDRLVFEGAGCFIEYNVVKQTFKVLPTY